MRVLVLSLVASAVLTAQPAVVLDQPEPPPDWALAERAVLDAASGAAEIFADAYLDERGFLKCVERWGGNDGADDAMENFGGWTLLYALGGDDRVLDLYRKAWQGHLHQFTLARAPGIPMAENGMYHREFVTSFDWEHTGEALAAFHLYGLGAPGDPRYKIRAERFARFYTGDDPEADNYDRELKIIKSIHNGSRGAKLTPATEQDWGGLPVEGDPERLTRYSTASNIRGDHPLNLAATALGFDAYALTGDERYRDWVLDYAGAWRDRVLANGGNIPTNIGLDGQIGGEWDGKWYGGTFGWNFWPQSSGRNYFIRGPRIAFGIGVLLSGDRSFMEPLRAQIQNLYAAKKIEGGRILLPGKHGDDGWYGYSGNQRLDVQRDVYLFTFDRTGLNGLGEDPWIQYLDGANPDFPVQALERDLETVRRKVAGIRSDPSVDYERTSDQPQRYNPASSLTLTELMLGGNDPGRSGNVVHTRLFYYDAARSRPGLPDQTAALVEKIGEDSVRVRLVNLDPLEARTVIVQAGAYGEHDFTTVKASSGAQVTVDGNRFTAHLAPGSGGVLDVGMDLFVNPPRFQPLP